MSKPFDVVGIGNAIVDVISRTTDEFLQRHGMIKGSMHLIDVDRARALYDDMGPAIESSGGSVANSIAGVAGLGVKAGFIGKVKSDQLGDVFAHDIRALGVEFTTPMATDGDPTARSMILVTPDGQRTMNTFLGASVTLCPADVDDALLRQAKMVYLEGYLWDPPEAKKAFEHAMDVTHAAQGRIAMTLSDSFCVDRYRAEFRALLDEDKIDVLFANEDELLSLLELDSFYDAVAAIRGKAEIVALTRSERGSLIITEDVTVEVAAEPAEVVDTTGAGDLYAAGFLAGLAQGRDLAVAGRMGSVCAAEIIGQVGPRAAVDLKALVDERLA